MARKKAPPGSLLKRPLGRNFIRAWRDKRTLTQESLADRVEELLGTSFTSGTLSRIENSKSPYSQRQLEALAEALGVQPADLLVRDPSDPEGLWSLWDVAKPGERRQAADVLRVLMGGGEKTGTGG